MIQRENDGNKTKHSQDKLLKESQNIDKLKEAYPEGVEFKWGEIIRGVPPESEQKPGQFYVTSNDDSIKREEILPDSSIRPVQEVTFLSCSGLRDGNKDCIQSIPLDKDFVGIYSSHFGKPRGWCELCWTKQKLEHAITAINDITKQPDKFIQPTRVKLLQEVIDLTTGDRNKQHGDWYDNHKTIASFWTTYLSKRFGSTIIIKPSDVSMLMVLLKAARHLSGSFNVDDYRDMACYATGTAENKQKEV